MNHLQNVNSFILLDKIGLAVRRKRAEGVFIYILKKDNEPKKQPKKGKKTTRNPRHCLKLSQVPSRPRQGALVSQEAAFWDRS